MDRRIARAGLSGLAVLISFLLVSATALANPVAHANRVVRFDGGDELLACAGASDDCISIAPYSRPGQRGVTIDASDQTTVTHRVRIRNFAPAADACAAPWLCMVVGLNAPVGTSGAYVVVNHGRAGPRELLKGVSDLTGITCPTASECLAIGNLFADAGESVVIPFTNGVPGTPVALTVPGQTELIPMNIACWNADDCVVDGDVSFTGDYSITTGVAIPVTDGTPGTPQQTAPEPPGEGDLFGTDLACAYGTSECYALGWVGTTPDAVPFTDGTFASPAAESPSLNHPAGFACETATTCFAVNPTGATGSEVVTLTNSVPQTPVHVPVRDLSGIACPTANGCVAVGRGHMVEIGTPFS